MKRKMQGVPHARTLIFQQILDKSGLTVREAAIRLGYHPHYFYMLGKGIRVPGARLIRSLEEEFCAREGPGPAHGAILKKLGCLLESAPLSAAEKAIAAASVLDYASFCLGSVIGKSQRHMKTVIEKESATRADSLRAELDKVGLGHLADVQPEHRKEVAARLITLLQEVLEDSGRVGKTKCSAGPTGSATGGKALSPRRSNMEAVV